MSDRLLRLPAAQAKYPKSRSVIYDEIRRGLFPPQVHMGGRLISFLESEVDAVVLGRAKGMNDEEIRELVSQLVTRRTEALVARQADTMIARRAEVA